MGSGWGEEEEEIHRAQGIFRAVKLFYMTLMVDT